MKRSRQVPQFRSKGNPSGDFYVLAFVRGLYKSRDESFLMLNYSPSKNFSRFSLSINSIKGEHLSYLRGNDFRSTVELALIEAWYEYEMPPHFWLLYPKELIAKAGFGNQKHRKLYLEARNELCLCLSGCRYHAWFKSDECAKQLRIRHFVKPEFQFKSRQKVQNPLESTPQNEEVLNATAKAINSRQKLR